MPKVRTLGSGPPGQVPLWREFEDQIFERYQTMSLNTKQFGEVIGIKNYALIKQWADAEHLTPIVSGSSKRWDIRAVAKARANAAMRAG